MSKELAKIKPNEIQAAMQAPKIRQGIDRGRLVQIYRKALALAGHRNVNEKDATNDISLLSEMLSKHYAGITMEELSYLSEKGAVGEYGQNIGISPATFVQWIKGYLQSTERKEALRAAKNKPKRIEPKKELSQKEKQELWEKAKRQVEAGQDVTGAIAIYKIGCDLGHIDLTDEMLIEEVRYKAVKWFEGERHRLMEQGGLANRLLIKSYKEVIDATEEERSKSTLWKSQCKRMAVEVVINNQSEKQ